MGQRRGLPGPGRALCWLLSLTLVFPAALWVDGPAAARPSVGSGGRAPSAAAAKTRFAVSPEYRLGPGDRVEIVLAGRVDVARHLLVVTPEGNLHLPPMGTIAVAGLTVAEARKAVASRAAPLFKFLNVALTVVTARSFEVTVSGRWRNRECTP